MNVREIYGLDVAEIVFLFLWNPRQTIRCYRGRHRWQRIDHWRPIDPDLRFLECDHCGAFGEVV